jgi:hypothetical protein
MNDLSAEALLARFFDVSVLRSYCESRPVLLGRAMRQRWPSNCQACQTILATTIGAIGGESGAKEETKSTGSKYRKKTPI